jgi:glycine cleavage system H lipoate-binding protein
VNSDPHTQWMIAVRLSSPGEIEALLDADQYSSLVK